VPCHRSLFLSASFPHAATRFSIYSPGRWAHGATAEHGEPTHGATFFPGRLLLPPTERGHPTPPSLNLVVVAPGWRVGVVRMVCPCRARTGAARLRLGKVRSTTAGGARIRGGRG
jgi:hypothetical protein